MGEIAGLEAGSPTPPGALRVSTQLKDQLTDLSRNRKRQMIQRRRMARRVLRGSLMGAAERVKDPEYRSCSISSGRRRGAKLIDRTL